jgi:hypothetical protein
VWKAELEKKGKTGNHYPKSRKGKIDPRKAKRNAPENRACTDESGINDDVKREYGRALRGVMAGDGKRGRKFHRVNAVAGQITARTV